ncbi:MAG: DUF4105 domain-containing protein [Flavobacteriales bacterium]
MRIIILFFLLSFGLSAHSQFERRSSDTSIYILTCSPGNDLYSVFGHTAILVKTPTSDWVYNYGTFDFNQDNFYVKFARGQLPYKLAKEQYGYFQYSYIMEQRQILAQELDLTRSQKTKLIGLLEENVLPENALYKYDFFLDNCATRVRDMIDSATDNEVEWGTNSSGNGYTFREMIQIYLGNMQWSDFGIDIALGLPCDVYLAEGQQAFLPDSLKHLFAHAQLNGKPLVMAEREALPAESYPQSTSFTDSTFKVITLISAVFFALILLFRNHMIGRFLSALVLVINGLVGLLIVFLWFFTDHDATANNLNILWANPFHLILPFIKRTKQLWLKIYTVSALILLAAWVFIPQDLHESLLPFIVLSILSAVVYGRLLPSKTVN